MRVFEGVTVVIEIGDPNFGLSPNSLQVIPFQHFLERAFWGFSIQAVIRDPTLCEDSGQ